jgi:hypothetical protein
MEETTYVLSIHDSIYTANVNHLLTTTAGRNTSTAEIQTGHDDNRECWFEKAGNILIGLKPDRFECAFGLGNDTCYDTDRGYEDPEWYWESSDGCVWGIGWRFGIPRLRGKGDITAEKAAHFLDFLSSALEVENKTQRSLDSLATTLENNVSQIILYKVQSAEFNLNDARVRKVVINALDTVAKTFDCTDKKWRKRAFKNGWQ